MIQPLYTSGVTGGNPVSPFLIGRWVHHSQSCPSPMPAAGTLRGWRLVYQSAPGGGKTVTLTIYKNNVATAFALTVSGSGTTASDLSTVLTVAAGDRIDVRYTATGGDSVLEYASVIEWTPDDGVTAVYGYSQSGEATLWDGTSTLYDGAFFGGQLAASSAAAASYVGSGAGGTVTKHYVNLNAAPGSGKSRVFTLLVAGVAQDGSGGTPDTRVTVSTAATTGSATFSLALAPGALVSVREVPSGTPTATGGSGGIAFVPTTAGQCPIGMDSVVGNANGTFYARVTGSYDVTGDGSTTEADRRLIGGETAIALTGMSVTLTAAPGTGKSRVFTLLVDGLATAQTVTLADSDTVVTCTAGAVPITATSVLTLREVRAGGPTSAVAKVTWYLGGVTLQGCAVFGVYTTVAATRAISFGLDGDTHIDTRIGTFTVHGDTWFDGDVEIEGDTLIHGNLEVEGDTVLDGDVTVLGTLTAPGVPGAPPDAAYVTLSADTELTAERVLTAGTGITITDGGPGSTVTIAATGGSGAGSEWSVLTNGDPVTPELIFDSAGDVIMIEILR